MSSLNAASEDMSRLPGPMTDVNVDVDGQRLLHKRGAEGWSHCDQQQRGAPLPIDCEMAALERLPQA